MDKVIIIYIILLLICSHVFAYTLGKTKEIGKNIKILEGIREDSNK